MHNRQRASFKVAELDCQEEVTALRRQLEPCGGIEQLDFDVLAGRMDVTYDPAQQSPAAIIDHVARLGMHARPWHQRQTTSEQTVWQRQGRFLLTSASGGCLVVALGTQLAVEAQWLPIWVTRWYIAAYLVAVAAGVWLVLPRAWASLLRARADMNLLMSLAVAGAILLGEWFEAATVSFLFALSLLLEQWSVGRARRAIARLLDLSPDNAGVVDPDSGEVLQQHIDEVSVGSLVDVRPGERIPLDGRLRDGQTTVNQAPITGESMPVAKRAGDEVFAGTINLEGSIRFQVTRASGNTTLAQIVRLIDQAYARRAPVEQWVERFARYYTPGMLALAVAVAVLPPLLMAAAWSTWFYNGLVVLVIACPCALVISTPVSIVSALTSAARQGVLVKGGQYLEAAASLRAIAFDKTGTLTVGDPRVQDVQPLNGHNTTELMERAAAMEIRSLHPIARAILHEAGRLEIPIPDVQQYQSLEGLGATGRIRERDYWIGSLHLMRQKHAVDAQLDHSIAQIASTGSSVIAVGTDEHVCGLISIADQLRPEAAGVVEQLRQLGLAQLVMLTGDSEPTARSIAAQAGLDQYFSELLPQDKVAAVERLEAQFGRTAMVGDGINDAPALAASSVGIAMGAMGADVAIETADIALMAGDLSALPWLIRHARRCLTIIRQNVAFALALKALFLVLATVGWANLWMAIAADTGASLLVIFNALRLLDA